MITPRLVVAAVLAFLVGWGVLVALALSSAGPQAPLPAGTGGAQGVPGAPGAPGASGAQPGERATPTRILDLDEVGRHARAEDCWIVVRGKVYDVTTYIPSHPTAARAITDVCGREATAAFETKNRGRPHSPEAWQLLARYLVGEVGAP